MGHWGLQGRIDTQSHCPTHWAEMITGNTLTRKWRKLGHMAGGA